MKKLIFNPKPLSKAEKLYSAHFAKGSKISPFTEIAREVQNYFNKPVGDVENLSPKRHHP